MDLVDMGLVAAGVLGIESMRSVWQALVDGLILGSGYAMVGVAFALILGVTRRFHFAFGLCYTVTAYLAAVALESLGVPLLVAALMGLLAGILLALLIEVVVYRPIVARSGGNSMLSIFVAGMGLTIAGENLIRLIWGNNTKIIAGTPGTSFSVGGVDFTLIEVMQVIVAGVLVVGLAALLNRSLLGQRIKAVRGNPDMAQAIGVNLRQVFLLVFAVGTFIGGVAALFEAVRFSVLADMGNIPVFYAFVVAFVAGVDRSPLYVGAVGLGFGIVARLSTLWVSENMSALVIFGLLCIWLTARVLPRAVRQLHGALAGRGMSMSASARMAGGEG